MYTNFLLFFLTICLFLIYICRKNNLIVDYKLEKHKRFSSKSKSNSIGGIFLIFLFYEYLVIDQNSYLFLILFSIFLIGFFSDIKKLNSVSLRFFLQIILILFL